MRHAIVIGRKHGEKTFATIVQPTDPRSANVAFKALLQEPGEMAEIQLWEANVTKRKRFGAPPAGESAPSELVIRVPSLEEVRAAGYIKPGVAESIVARQQARADALAANPDISDEELERIEGPAVEDSGPFAGLTDVQLRERCAELGIDVSGCVNAADFIAALELHKEAAGDGPTI